MDLQNCPFQQEAHWASGNVRVTPKISMLTHHLQSICIFSLFLDLKPLEKSLVSIVSTTCANEQCTIRHNTHESKSQVAVSLTHSCSYKFLIVGIFATTLTAPAIHEFSQCLLL